MQNIDQLLRENELYHLKSEIMASMKNSIKIDKVQMDEDDMPIGTSKMGGLPDMPDWMEFPEYGKGDLWFIGQFNLAEAKPFDQDNLLPDSGILYLFYDAYEQPWGFEEDEGCFKVLYFDGDVSELKRRPYPAKDEGYQPLEAYKVEFKNMYTISEEAENLPFLDEDEEDRFMSFRQELIQPEDEEGNVLPAHYMLGEPFNIQNDVFEELYEDTEDAVLLFQIDSDEDDLGVMWGDAGMLYFCIKKEKLKKKQFDKVKFTLQCF